MTFYSQLAKYLEHIIAVLMTALALYEHFHVIRGLKRDKKALQGEIDALKDEKHRKSAEMVERLLLSVSPPICTVCKELLLLRFCTTFDGAIKHLGVLPSAVEQSPRTADIPLVLGVMERAMDFSLWPRDLENPNARGKPKQDLIIEAVKAYVGLIPHMGDEAKRKAVQFCAATCNGRSSELKTEVVRNLLPHLLVACRGDSALIQAYSSLLALGLMPLTDEQKTLLIAVFGGLQLAAETDSPSVSEILDLAFMVAKKNVQWAWEDEGPKIGTSWTIAIENRLRYFESHESCSDPQGRRSFPQEKESLKHAVGLYLTTEDAPSHRLSYHQLVGVFDMIRQSIDPRAKPLRKPDRAVVPNDSVIRVKIAVSDSSSAPMEAKLVNFSLDSSVAEVRGHGAWATGPVNEQWHPSSDWRDANVRIVMPTPTFEHVQDRTDEGEVVFDRARVLGPVREGHGDNTYYGFRIRLGPGSPPERMHSLKRRWDTWEKR